ncbi:alpha-amylase family glycosyl hydrolase [Lachnoclostridium sp. Marseille-P6806]|uniref:alpha-amylase family glycosyl hydrolase n=1 Tax=Lachnoclostridium sp. Marseille-P6806 TaxID=2364793 RepID=UPI00102F3517|nr:hypothetical protein [Lachnoclostridium sp. Marseille-P6806]
MKKTVIYHKTEPDSALLIEPACAQSPGCFARGRGMVFAAAIAPEAAERFPGTFGLRLYDLETHTRCDIPFRDEYRTGSLYSVYIEGLCAPSTAYCFFIGGETLSDPFSCRLGVVDDASPVPAALPGELGPRPRVSPLRGRYRWPDRVWYILNVRAFTMGSHSGVKKRGSFAGLSEKIPYLKELGVTTVELMPVFALLPSRDHDRPNLWGFGDAYLRALRPELASVPAHAETEFLALVQSFHDAGLELILQMCFSAAIPDGIIIETVRYWAARYGIDGVHLMGPRIPLEALAADPLLADLLLTADRIPAPAPSAEEPGRFVLAPTSPPGGPRETGEAALHCAEYSDRFLYLVRAFVKGDDLVLSDFIRAFLDVPKGHGKLRYAATYHGFTLRDLVTYSRKHNEANGEDNRDGSDNNVSWNCGVEGNTRRKDVLALRRRQLRNFLALVLLSQGTPLLFAGDERGNSQGGNNNPYCQDNETGWTSWQENAESRALHSFCQELLWYRREHPVFRRREPFRFSDYRSVGFPDLSYHGRDAWKPDLTGSSHSVGLLYCENYGSGAPDEAQNTEGSAERLPRLLYLAVNMYWQSSPFGLPHLKEQSWQLIIDTSREHPFLDEKEEIGEASLTVPARSIMLLQTVPAPGLSQAEETGCAVPKADSPDERHRKRQ